MLTGSLPFFPPPPSPFLKSCASYFRFARFNMFPLYYLRAWHRLHIQLTCITQRGLCIISLSSKNTSLRKKVNFCHLLILSGEQKILVFSYKSYAGHILDFTGSEHWAPFNFLRAQPSLKCLLSLRTTHPTPTWSQEGVMADISVEAIYNKMTMMMMIS